MGDGVLLSIMMGIIVFPKGPILDGEWMGGGRGYCCCCMDEGADF